MVLINQRVADEIGTLVARHRYGVEDATDAVKSAEAASAQRNEEIRAEAAERRQGLAEQAEQAKEAHDKPQNEWSPRRHDEVNELSFGTEDAEYEQPAQSPATQSPAASPPVTPMRRRRPAFDEDDDFEGRSWLR